MKRGLSREQKIETKKEQVSKILHHQSSREYFDNAIASSTDYPSAISAPDNGADTFSTHQPVAGDFLSATALLQ
jgi:hypothetical protein